MPKIYCRCNNEISLVTIPCPSAYLIVAESVIDTFYESTESSDDTLIKLSRAGNQVYRCSKCGRLIVFWDRDKNVASFYSLEEADPFNNEFDPNDPLVKK